MIEFLAVWTLRSAILIASGVVLLWALRVKDPAVRLAAWIAILCGSLSLPLLTAVLPKVPIVLTRPAPAVHTQAPVTANGGSDSVGAGVQVQQPASSVDAAFPWTRVALAVYALGALVLLLRLGIGLAIALRFLRGSRATGRMTGRTIGGAIELRESNRLRVPVTLGIVRPAIVLPQDWREWDAAKLEAVVAHEAAHLRRRDPAVQLLSAIHRALLWHSPLSWFLHARIVRSAEEASDDSAVALTGDRAFYAEVLLEFVGRKELQNAPSAGVPMARYGRPDQRIHRILDGKGIARGLTRGSLATILLLGLPLVYLVSTAALKAAQSAQPHAATAVPSQPIRPAPAAPQAAPTPTDASIVSIGNIVPSQIVTVKPRVDGELLSVNFKEGETVQQGQLLATIDPRSCEVQVQQAEGQFAQDEATLAGARAELNSLLPRAMSQLIPQSQVETQKFEVARLQAKLKTDEAAVNSARVQLSYTQIHAPIGGVVGLRHVDPGNIVHPSDTILVITQLQPAAVVFQIPESDLPQVRASMAQGATVPVEVWNRDMTAKIGAGRLSAIDNQIDSTTGTLKLKAVLDNENGALYPNQFVNVRLSLTSR